MEYLFLSLIEIIEGGMGVNISRPLLARIVSSFGKIQRCLGTISGTALERVMADILARGDPGGDIRRALSHFPFQEYAKMVINAYFIPEGSTQKPRAVPVYSTSPSKLLIASIICANFAFVWLAKEGHNRAISINYLEKIALPHIYAVTGAMLAGVDVITMGAGLPFDMPKVITALLEGRTLEYPVPVIELDKTRGERIVRFNPQEFFGAELPQMKRPAFLPIISSMLLAKLCLDPRRIPEGGVQGLVVEEATAGGHNASPRDKPPIFDEIGQPQYGPKDKIDYTKLAAELQESGLPFWIGGSYASPERLNWAIGQGAKGIQVGTAFALCEESGMDPVIRTEARRLGFRGELVIRTDPIASPTGFPFKVAQLAGTVSDQSVYQSRRRICNQGALVVLYRRSDGKIGTRCPAEPEEDFVRKGGKKEDAVGRKCLCNGLLRTAGLTTDQEPAIVTLGDDYSFLRYLMYEDVSSYRAHDVIRYLLDTRRDG